MSKEQFKLSAGWEIKDEESATCRWFCAWGVVGSDKKIAGAIAGYSGGGCFEVERFYGQLQYDEFSSLWVDCTDLVSGEEIEFEDLDEEVLDICNKGMELLWEWNDEDEWYDCDGLLLLNAKKGDLEREGDMLYLKKGEISEVDTSVIHSLCEGVGLTAAPAE